MTADKLLEGTPCEPPLVPSNTQIPLHDIIRTPRRPALTPPNSPVPLCDIIRTPRRPALTPPNSPVPLCDIIRTPRRPALTPPNSPVPLCDIIRTPRRHALTPPNSPVPLYDIIRTPRGPALTPPNSPVPLCDIIITPREPPLVPLNSPVPLYDIIRTPRGPALTPPNSPVPHCDVIITPREPALTPSNSPFPFDGINRASCEPYLSPPNALPTLCDISRSTYEPFLTPPNSPDSLCDAIRPSTYMYIDHADYAECYGQFHLPRTVDNHEYTSPSVSRDTALNDVHVVHDTQTCLRKVTFAKVYPTYMHGNCGNLQKSDEELKTIAGVFCVEIDTAPSRRSVEEQITKVADTVTNEDRLVIEEIPNEVKLNMSDRKQSGIRKLVNRLRVPSLKSLKVYPKNTDSDKFEPTCRSTKSLEEIASMFCVDIHSDIVLRKVHIGQTGARYLGNQLNAGDMRRNNKKDEQQVIDIDTKLAKDSYETTDVGKRDVKTDSKAQVSKRENCISRLIQTVKRLILSK